MALEEIFTTQLYENFILFLDILKYSWLTNVLPQCKHCSNHNQGAE
jgi:hypothetical protein